VSSVLRGAAVRIATLTDPDHHELTRLVADDPLVNAAVAARLRKTARLAMDRLGGEVLGVRDDDGRLAAAAVHAGNLLPIGGGPSEWAALGSALAVRPRRCTSIVGRVEAVAGLWAQLEHGWGPARAIRHRQPLLVLGRAARLPVGDPRVRPVAPAHVDAYLDASAAMFTEELGVAPHVVTSAVEYRRRVTGLIRQRRAFGIVERNGTVLFKADLGVLSAHTCQVAGVWVRPDRRGRGVGTAAVAAVLRHALTLAPTASLYVNDFNLAARRMYDRIGMRQVAELSTVLF
jgi:predicted GNAT family acetyltransferase